MTALLAAVLALLPGLVSSQTPPQDVITFGGYPSSEFALGYYRASHTTNITNAVNFPGYKWTDPPTGESSSGQTNSSTTWQMHLNYSQVAVPTYKGDVTTGFSTLSITFPEEQWGLHSAWSLCATLAYGNMDFTTTGNNSDGSCGSFLGPSCADALLRAYQRQPLLNSVHCPTLPSLGEIDECKSVASRIDGTGTATISNTTSPDLVYNETQDINVTGGGQTYLRSNVSYQGLSSGQAFAGFLKVFDNSTIKSQSEAESKVLRVVGLSIVPSVEYIQNSTRGFVWNQNARLVCLRANTSGAAPSIKNAPTAVIMSVVVAVASMIMLQ